MNKAPPSRARSSNSAPRQGWLSIRHTVLPIPAARSRPTSRSAAWPDVIQLTASTTNKAHTKVTLTLEEIALGYQQTLGRQLDDQYCERCHNPESTVERVSNFDNLEIKPHPFTDGDTLNKISDADLTAIISHGGPALNKSALMPAWGNTLNKSDIQALVSYIRAISDPPNRNAGPLFAKN